MVVSIGDIHVDDAFVSSSRTIREADVVNFAGLSGDFNPLHTDEEWVRTATPFASTIAHGLLVTAIGSGLRTPGLDDWHIIAYLGVERRFVAPAFPGDTVHQRSVVTEVRRTRSNPANGVVVVRVETINHRGEVVQSGTDTYLIGTADESEDTRTGERS